MDYKNKEERFTVQGADPPVPVGVAGERAGPAQPSSNDCPVPLVGNQARGDYTVTGRDMGGMEAFERVPRIARTPPHRRARVNSLPERMDIESYVGKEARGSQPQAWEDESRKLCSAPTSPDRRTELAWRDKEERTSKRRRDDLETSIRQGHEPEDGGIAEKIKTVTGSLEKEIMRVVEVAKERNTKKEVKEAASVMKRLIRKLFQTLEEYTDKPDIGRKQPEEDKEEISKRLEEEIKTLKGEVARLQEENRVILGKLKTSTQKRGREESNQVTEEQVDRVKSYQDLIRLEECFWPNRIFKVTHIAKGNLADISKDADLALMTENTNDEATDKHTNRLINSRFPELSDAVGKLTMMTVATEIEDITGQREARNRIIFKAVLEEDKEDWFNAMCKIKEKMVIRDRAKLIIQPLPKDRGGTHIRKITESVFRHTGIKCVILVNEGEGSERTRVDKNRNPNTEALTIKQEGKSYSELLKMVKERVKPGTEVANAIKVVRKSRDGNLLIIMDKGNSELTKELKADLVGTTGNMDVRTSRTNGTVLIKDIDGETTKEDVESAIARETGIEKDQFEVGELRPYFGGNQAVSIRVNKNRMPEMLKRERIRIGLNYCNVTERINVNQCYRCWAYGHRREECQGEDRSAACRRCGETNHMARDCSKNMYCLNCNKEGHSAGTGRCPEFRKAISRARRLAKAKKYY